MAEFGKNAQKTFFFGHESRRLWRTTEFFSTAENIQTQTKTAVAFRLAKMG